MIQPNVDLACSPGKVLWDALHGPKNAANMLGQCWRNAATGSPVLTPELVGDESEAKFGIQPLLDSTAPPYDSPVADQPAGFNEGFKMHMYVQAVWERASTRACSGVA